MRLRDLWRVGVLLLVPAFLPATASIAPTPAQELRGDPREMTDLQAYVDRQFDFRERTGPQDIQKVKRAVVALAEGTGFFRNSRLVQVYWKKTDFPDETSERCRKGYLVLVVDAVGGFGEFALFCEDAKDLKLDNFAALGLLMIEKKTAACRDCQGGLWMQTYIAEASNRLLKRNRFNMNLAKDGK